MKDNIKPIIRFKIEAPTFSVQKTEALLKDDGITYDEPGYSYDQSGVVYGGLYGNDTVPMYAYANVQNPSIRFIMDFSGTEQQHGTIILGQGMLIGMLGMTYPESGTIIF